MKVKSLNPTKIINAKITIIVIHCLFLLFHPRLYVTQIPKKHWILGAACGTSVLWSICSVTFWYNTDLRWTDRQTDRHRETAYIALA